MSDFHYIDAPRSLGRTGRIITWVVVLAVLAGVGTAVVLVSDGYVRDAATGVVRSAVSGALGLDADADVEIDVGDGLLIAQALTGRVDEVTATVEEFALAGQGAASLELRVVGIPIPPTGPVESVTSLVSFSEPQLLAMQAAITGATLTDLEFTGGAVNVTSAVDVGGTIVPLVIGLVPSVSEGSVVFTPSNVRFGETTDLAVNLLAGPSGPLLAPLLAPRSLCVAALLPAALTVESAEVTDSALVISAAGSDVRLTESAFTTKGACVTA